MNDKIFTCKNLEQCLKLASEELNIDKNDLEYKIIEEKNGFFIKKVSILVSINNLKDEIKNLNGNLMIKDGQVIVENPKEGGKAAIIEPFNEGIIFINGKEIKESTEVLKKDSIEIKLNDGNIQSKCERQLDITITEDKMRAYAKVNYIPTNVYTIKDTEKISILKCEKKLKEQIFPNTYTIDEIKEALSSGGIKYGIILKNLVKLLSVENTERVLVAEGKKVIDGTDDILHMKFLDNNHKKFEEDKEGRIDYKSIGHIESVKPGDVLIVKEDGIEGEDGVDVKENLIKHQKGKRLEINIGEGCEMKDDHTVISTKEGKVSYKGNIISVHEVHQVHDDVDVKSGNIQFIGDVYIGGNVKEGMEVEAGNNVIVNKNVDHAKVISLGDMKISGNIIGSVINAGGENVIKLNKLKTLETLYDALLNLISTVDHIKKFNLLGKEVRDGEIVKVLIENKFKHIIDLCNDFVQMNKKDSTTEEESLANMLKERLIGFAPLNIKDISECSILVKKLKNNISILKGNISIPVDMKISYCQDSVVKCSGNIEFTGKGEYVSTITSHENIEFTNPNSWVRGGTISAKDYIKCKNVGSEGGVSTKFVVEEKGDIWIEKAYQNTHFVVGGKEFVLDVPSRDIHVYLDENRELMVDKFVL